MVRLRQRGDGAARTAGGYGNSSGAGLCAFASQAWNSLEFLDHSVKLGWFLRAVHGWGSDFMIAIVLIHMAQVFLFGAYKFPRDDVDCRRVSASADVGDGVYRAGVALRSGCVLGARHWRLDCEPRAFDGGWLVDLMLGGPIIGSHADAFLCAACICDSGDTAYDGGLASLDGSSSWR